MTTSMLSRCADTETILPATPFTALQYHFGMLLGVDDLETAQAYPRGKLRLHNAWLHGEGVVWGFNVLFNERHELAVEPGLAVDAAGRELHLDQRACLDLGKWYGAHKDDTTFTFKDDAHLGGKVFTSHVVARFKVCLARPVPAIADPCEGAQTDTAYSRALETVELLIRPGKAPVTPRPYHRLRVLFQIEADSVALKDVRLRRESIQALAPADQPAAFLAAFREFAALDTIDLKPQQAAADKSASIFPEEPTEVVLADLEDIVIGTSAGGGFVILAPLPVPKTIIRPALVATTTIQELLNGPLFGGAAGGGTGNTPTPTPTTGTGTVTGATDAGGPRVIPGTVVVNTSSVTFSTNGPLEPNSLDERSILLSLYNPAKGWKVIDVTSVTMGSTTTDVTVKTRDIPPNLTVRVIVKGTDRFPVLGTNLIPLAGVVGGPPGTKDDGHDFVLMTKRS